MTLRQRIFILTVIGLFLSQTVGSPKLWAKSKHHHRGRQPAAAEVTSSASAQTGGLFEIEVERVEGQTLFFRVPEGKTKPAPQKVDLHDISPLGAIGKTVVLAAKPCQNCSQEKAIYLLTPGKSKPQPYVFPGKILDPKTRAVLLESRGFFGKCLNRRGPVYVVYQKERVDRRKSLQTSVFFAEPNANHPGHLDETLLERHLPSLNETLRMVKLKTCREVPGSNRMMLSRPLDLKPRNSREQNEDDDSIDDTPKENATDKDIGPITPPAPTPSALPSAPHNP